MKKIIVFITIITLFGSCETDIEINAPYEKIPIIYGVLDQSVDTQWIKINKSFLGTNNTAYSSINDSMYFNNVDVKVEELDGNGNVGNVFSLQSKFVPVVPGSGIFFTGQQEVYYFVSSALDNNKTYRIVGNGDGNPFSATTNIIDPFDFSFKFKNTTLVSDIKLYNVDYTTIKPDWTQSPDAESYNVSMRFYYTEHKSGNVFEKFIDWNMGSANPTTSGNLKVERNTESFFALLSNNKDLQDTTGVTKRVIGKVDFRVTSSNLILKTYMDVNRPSTGIAFDKPDYTNIDGGRGIWASRFTAEITGRNLSEETVEHLYNSPFTTNFKFCSNNPAWSTDPYFCP